MNAVSLALFLILAVSMIQVLLKCATFTGTCLCFRVWLWLSRKTASTTIHHSASPTTESTMIMVNFYISLRYLNQFCSDVTSSCSGYQFDCFDSAGSQIGVSKIFKDHFLSDFFSGRQDLRQFGLRIYVGVPFVLRCRLPEASRWSQQIRYNHWSIRQLNLESGRTNISLFI